MIFQIKTEASTIHPPITDQEQQLCGLMPEIQHTPCITSHKFNSLVAHLYEFDQSNSLSTWKTPQLDMYKPCCIIGKCMSTNSDWTGLAEAQVGRTCDDVVTNQTVGGGDSPLCFVLLNLPMLWWQPPDQDNQHEETAGHYTRLVWVKAGNKEHICLSKPSKSYFTNVSK